jgi:hypothetical protein
MPASPDPRRFYVVWSPQGGPPVVRFPSFNAARSAAIRLSGRFPGQDFFVLASCLGKIGDPPAGDEPLDAGDSIPEPDAAP